jgi:predicted Zn-dependent protease
MKRIIVWILGSITGVVLFSACTTNPVTGRKELTGLVSPQQEIQLGLQSFDQMKSQVPIDHDPADNATVERVGQRLAAVASKDMPDAKWEFVVFDSPEANAFCLPGGKVGVYKGILPICKDDVGLATVLGHEIAHAVSHHGAERISQGELLQGFGQALSQATQNTKPITQTAVSAIYGLGGQLGYTLPHSRAQESEADHIGLIYMARAGYDPRGAVEFWQRFAAYNEQHGGSKTPSLLSDHPVDSKRIQQLQGWLPEAEKQYRAANNNTSPVTPTGRTPAPGSGGSEIIGQPRSH